MIRRHGRDFLAQHGDQLCVQQRKVLAALAACRTARMGGHLHRCTTCGDETPLYNSCGDRHCPQCQASQRAAWLNARQRELLPVGYYHVVFTVPRELDCVAAAHPGMFYNKLFQAVRETLLEVAATPRHLGARIGGLMVLHTWGQTLQLHPHVHVIVPGGGLSADGTQWISCAPGFFLPVKVLSRVFRGKLLDFLRQESNGCPLTWRGSLTSWSNPQAFAGFLTSLARTDWVVYAQPPVGGPEVVLKYLARYTYRVAISNDRIESIADGQVTFRYKDYARGHRWRRMKLSADKFLRRFLQHVLPRGFVRIRSFGLLSHRQREERLALCRQFLGEPPVAPAIEAAGAEPAPEDTTSTCPHCGGVQILVAVAPRARSCDLVSSTYSPQFWNSS